MKYLILLSFIFVIEAWLEVVVINLKNSSLSNYNSLNHQEHFRSAIWAATLILSFCSFLLQTSAYYLIPAAFIARRVFFDYSLILFRNRPKNLYEGNDWWAQTLSFIFSKKGRKSELIITIILYIVCVILHFRTSHQPW